MGAPVATEHKLMMIFPSPCVPDTMLSKLLALSLLNLHSSPEIDSYGHYTHLTEKEMKIQLP